MKKFNYRAKSKEGKTLTGVVEASNEKQAITLLHDRGLTIISLVSHKEQAGLGSIVKTFQKTSFGNVVNFTRQLSTMITAGLSLTNALSLLETQLGPAMGGVIGRVLRQIEGGESLGDALAKHPQVFSKVYVALVRAGESAGVLDKVLGRLADNLEKQREFKGKVKGALIYPVIIVIGIVIVAFIMLVFSSWTFFFFLHACVHLR